MADFPEAAPHTAFQRWVIYPLGRAFAWVLLTLCGPFRVRGAERIPREGGVLILPNHLADVDPFLTQIACPRNIHFMAKSELFEVPVIGPILKAGGAFPVKRGEPDRGALKYAAALLKAGEVVCIYPEGQLSETGELGSIKPGIALIVRMAGAQVQCLGITGTQRIMPYGKVIPRLGHHPVRAVWGEPRTFTKEDPPEAILGWVESELRQLTRD